MAKEQISWKEFKGRLIELMNSKCNANVENSSIRILDETDSSYECRIYFYGNLLEFHESRRYSIGISIESKECSFGMELNRKNELEAVYIRLLDKKMIIYMSSSYTGILTDAMSDYDEKRMKNGSNE